MFIFSFSYAQPFEGKISMKVFSDESMDMDYLVKGDNIRIEIKENDGGYQGSFIYNGSDNKMLIIMPEQKMYMEIPLGDMYDSDDYEGTEEDVDINVTGETKMINGYNCEKWIIKNEDEEVEVWMAKGLGGFFMFQNPMDHSPKSAWQSKLKAGNYFPMQVVENKKVVMEVTSVDKKALKDDLFTVPKDFQKFEMPGMK